MSVFRTSASVLAALSLAVGVAACGGGEEAPQTGGEPGEGAPAMQIENPGAITGTIAFEGTPPPNESIDMSQEPTCAEKHSEQPTQQTVLASDGRLQNVFVYVKEGLPAGNYPAPTEQTVIDQQGCVYVPHVSGVQVNQPLVFRNSDGILHNINARPANQPGFNISQPTNMESPRTFRAAEVMVPVQCDVHGWMQAYVGVVDHPYFAVAGEDGTFRIENLPPGTYTIEAWHERYGTQTQQVTVEPNGTQDLTFNYNAAMAENAVVPLGTPIDPHDHGPATRHAGGAGAH